MARHILFLTALVMTCGLSLDARAVIGGIAEPGGIGSPVVPSNLPKAKAKEERVPPGEAVDTDAAAIAAPAPREPLLVIPFNQRQVNFAQSLTQAVLLTERRYPNAGYEVVSVVPRSDGASLAQSERRGEAYGDNVSSVVDQLLDIGVSQHRIHTRTAHSDKVTVQEIRLYILPGGE